MRSSHIRIYLFQKNILTENFDEYVYVGYYVVEKNHQDKDYYTHPGDLVQAQAFEVGHPGVK